VISKTLAMASVNFLPGANPLAGAYIDHYYLDPSNWTYMDQPTGLVSPWLFVSHWIQPWRAWQTTVPASQFITVLNPKMPQ
jgi:hypothetical protein